jgi:hypothetical protein
MLEITKGRLGMVRLCERVPDEKLWRKCLRIFQKKKVHWKAKRAVGGRCWKWSEESEENQLGIETPVIWSWRWPSSCMGRRTSGQDASFHTATVPCEIWGSCSGVAEDPGLLECDTMSPGECFLTLPKVEVPSVSGSSNPWTATLCCSYLNTSVFSLVLYIQANANVIPARMWWLLLAQAEI